MCGIAGMVDRATRRNATALEGIAAAMAEHLRHRGPDDGGTWSDPAAGVAFGFRRLAIIDLTPAGHQPMVSADGGGVIVFNGEIYNAEDIRRELNERGGAPTNGWRGHSDTEVLLQACRIFGVAPTVERLIGMFAFALWERDSRRLSLVRDRLGIKPLYWSEHGGQLLFGSELKALRAHPDFAAAIDRAALASYLRHAYVPSPRSIYQGVRKLPPGHILTATADGRVSVDAYWSLRRIATDGARAATTGAAPSDADATAALDALLRDAVQRRMVADVPLGAFLSGGIDSSTVAALMQAQSDRPVKTFTIGFHEVAYDEAAHARQVAAHLKTEHTELYLNADDALDLVPRIPDWYDEPFADASQLPTYLVSQLTRRHVTVALSGDGGDELFAGYSRYAWAETLAGWTHALPKPFRHLAAAGLCALPKGGWDGLARLIPPRQRPRLLGHKVHKVAGLLREPSVDAVYRRLVTFWDAADLLRDPPPPEGALWDETLAGDIPDFTSRMQYLDSVTYLPDDILAKVDRASMAVSLEARVPLLDHRVVGHVWQLPLHLKLRDGQTKWLLRQVLYRYVPRALVERPKMGFAVPIGAWLRGPLRDWAESLLDESRLRREGLLQPEPIRRKWHQHLTGEHDWQYDLWVVLMFQAWHARWLP